MSRKVKYGIINPTYPIVTLDAMPIAASQAFKAKSGRFVTKDASGNYAISVAADTQIAGYVDCGDFTSSSTAAADKLPVIVDLNAIFEIPVDETITATSLKALIGKTCDLVVNSGIQQADIGASATDVIKIVGGDVDEQTVYVMINPTKFYTEGVA
jgi:hypothetical protein